MDQSSKTIEELQKTIGKRLQALRLSRNLTQLELAAKAGLAMRTVSVLETGSGSTVESLLRFLKALDAADSIELLAPQPQVSPLALLQQTPRLRRVGRSRARHGRKA